jgi:hypothetical protein
VPLGARSSPALLTPGLDLESPPVSKAGTRGGGVFAGAGGVAAVLGAAVALVLRLAPLDDPARPEPEPDLEGFAPEVTATSEAPPGQPERVSADRLLAAAARTLREAGTFAYTGTVLAPGASVTWPTGLAGVEVDVDGRVALPIRAVERATMPGVVADTIISGRGVWQRAAPTAAALDNVAWRLVAQGPPELGLARLPDLLEGVVDGEVSGPTDNGGRTVTGVVDQLDVAGASGPVPGRLEVVLDGEGVPRHVVVVAAAPAAGAEPAAPAFRVDVEIRDLGLEIDIGPPGERELGIVLPVSAADVSAAGLAAAVQFTQLPEGVVLADVNLAVRDTDPGCPVLRLVYDHAVTGGDERLTLEIENVACLSEHEPAILDPKSLGAGWWGTARADGPIGARVEASNGTTYVDARARSLSAEELVELVTTLGVYDPASPPYLVAPPGTPVLGGEPPT